MTATKVRLTRARRKALFRRALKAAGLTAQDWIGQQGVSRGHFYEVLAGDRISAPLTAKIDAFIALHSQEKAA